MAGGPPGVVRAAAVTAVIGAETRQAVAMIARTAAWALLCAQGSQCLPRDVSHGGRSGIAMAGQSRINMRLGPAWCGCTLHGP